MTHESVTRILAELPVEDTAPSEEVLPRLYDELHAMAIAFFRDQKPGHTLQPTALVHEAYLKIADADSGIDGERSRAQFFALASKVMRHILVDHARARAASKRGGDWNRVTLTGIGQDEGPRDLVDLLVLEEALQRLQTLNPEDARLVEMRFYGGLTSEQAAEALGLSRNQAARRWAMVRAWLAVELGHQDDAGEN